MASLFRRLFRFLSDRLSFFQSASSRIFARLHAYLFPADRVVGATQQHLDRLKKSGESMKEYSKMVDKFVPMLPPEDGSIVASMVSSYSSHYFTPNAVVKRQPHRDEAGLDIYGKPCVFPYIGDRIRIEAANLNFIGANTTIPVPKVLGVWQEHGLWHIKTSLIQGAVNLQHVDDEKMDAAVAEVEKQLEAYVLPQLRRLHRSFMGCADPDLPVVPPHRFWAFKDRRIWSSMPTDNENAYVFCHTDLGRQNIMVDPDTFRIMGIIDWETAGFWPASWELPLWKTGSHQERHQMTMKNLAAEREMIEAHGLEDNTSEKDEESKNAKADTNNVRTEDIESMDAKKKDS